MRFGAVLLLLATLACSKTVIDRAEWQRMPHEDRVLLVKSLISEEQSRNAKGGDGKRVDLPAEDYVARIDAAYARGEQRPAHEVFKELTR
jgi:hypothetical protein